MNSATSAQRQQFWSHALSCLMEPDDFPPSEPAIIFAADEIFDYRQVADLRLMARSSRLTVLYARWNSAWPSFPIEHILFFPIQGRPDVVRGLSPWIAGDDRQMMLVEPRGTRAFGVGADGIIAPQPRPACDIERGILLAQSQIGRVARQFARLIAPYPEDPSEIDDAPF